ncbi:MAG: 30S ribosomal protein S24e [Candidatus Poseidoniaceae archaeon]
MEIVNRTENKLLHRVEIEFRWKHPKQSTPSRKAVIEMVRGLEPGANPDLVVVKDCNTRFGMAMTTGRAYVYANAEAMSVEPTYIHKRHEDLHSAPAEPEAEANDDEGGEA